MDAGARRDDGVRTGSAVGLVGGLVFVLVNAGGLPGSTGWRVVGVAAAVAVLALVLTRPAPPPVDPAPGALRTYLLCVVAMLVAIPAGASALRALDLVEVVLPWVVLVVGAHFLPFAAAFGAPVFRVLGLVMVGLGVVGGAVATAGVDAAGPATGVAAGFALLAAAATPWMGAGGRAA